MNKEQSALGEEAWSRPWIRWLALFPAAVVAAALTSLATNLLAGIAGAGSGTWFGLEVTSSDPDSDINKGLGFCFIKYIFQPAAIAGAFVYTARRIAPGHKQIVGWLCTCAPVLVSLWLYSLVAKTTSGHLGLGNWLILLSCPVGGIIGAKTKMKD